jgi:Domain of Unknown Function with PDB structure (DUF3857)/Transglutaminase-like superfamily
MPIRTLALVAFLAAATTLFAGFSQSQDFRPATAAEREMKNVPSAPGAPAAILDWVRLDDHPVGITSEYYRIKVFAEEGKKYGDVEIAYFPTYPEGQRVTDISARTIQPDGRIVPFDGKVYDKVLYKAGRRQWKAKAFSLADVQPGSILEYRYQIRSNPNVLFDAAWILQRDIPILHTKLSLKPYDTRGQFASYFNYVGLPDGKVPQRKGNTYHLELENLPAFHDEAFAPPQEQLKTRVNFYYTDPRLQPDQFWQVQWADWTKSIEKFIGNPSAYNQHVQKGAEPQQTLKNLYAKAQSLKNLSYASEITEAEAPNGAQVLSTGAGYAHEINRAFVGMARAAGFEAYVVRVAPRLEGFFQQQMLDATQISDEVAAIVLPGQPLLHLDPGTPGAPFGTVSWEKTNAPGMKMAKGGTLQWVKIPATTPQDAVLQRRADLRVNGDMVEGTITVTSFGQEALRRRANSWSEDEEARKKTFEEEAKEWFAEGATVKLEELTGMNAHEGPLVAKYSVKMPLATAGSRLTVPLSFFAAAQKNPFAPATRTHPVYFPYPFRTEDEVALTLPENVLPAALPPPVNLDAGPFKYTGTASRNGNVVTYKRTMMVDGIIVEAKHYNPLRNFYNAVVAADQRPLLLVASQ